MPRPVLIALAVLGLAVGLGLGWLRLRSAPPPAMPAGRPAFSLTDHAGRPLTEAGLRGRVALVYFGYTFCPDVCPTELGFLARLMRALGPQAQEVRVLMVSVDPARDTPAKLKDYVTLFDPAFIGATGTAEQVAAAAAAFGAVYRKAEVATAQPGWYLMDHTSTTFILGADGALLGKIDSHAPFEQGLAAVRAALAVQAR